METRPRPLRLRQLSAPDWFSLGSADYCQSEEDMNREGDVHVGTNNNDNKGLVSCWLTQFG